MPKKIILLLSGEICAGKTSLANQLSSQYGFDHLRTRDLLEKLHKGENPRRVSLQQLGEKLDGENSGQWVVTELQKHEEGRFIDRGLLIVDAIRIEGQLQRFREAFGPAIVHVHLRCSPETLYERYRSKHGKARAEETIRAEYRKVKANQTEQNVASLADTADLVIDTKISGEDDTAIRVASFLGLLAPVDRRLVDVVIGAQFGSEGKGQVCAHLAPEYDVLVRVGGPNAGHTVYGTPPSKFHLLPSGSTKSPQSKLILGPGAVLDLGKLRDEILMYGITVDRLLIDRNATIITNADKEYERRLVKEIGSTGQGVGAATANNILNRIPGNKNKAISFEKELKGLLGSAHEELELTFRKGGRVLLEGTQGTHLSIHHGIYPFVTSRDTTVSGCLAEAGIAPRRVRKIILVTRTYPIRVKSPDVEGKTSGPFNSAELTWDEIASRSGIPVGELQEQEKTTTTRRLRRVSEFNWSLFRRSCELNSPTDVALTFVDYFSIANRKARRFEQLDSNTIHFIEEIERCASVPVSLISTRFAHRCIIDRRNWKAPK